MTIKLLMKQELILAYVVVYVPIISFFRPTAPSQTAILFNLNVD